MLLEEDVAMKKREETRRPARLDPKVNPPAPIQPEEPDRQVSDDLPWFPVSPPPVPWPRVFPGL